MPLTRSPEPLTQGRILSVATGELFYLPSLTGQPVSVRKEQGAEEGGGGRAGGRAGG